MSSGPGGRRILWGLSVARYRHAPAAPALPPPPARGCRLGCLALTGRQGRHRAARRRRRPGRVARGSPQARGRGNRARPLPPRASRSRPSEVEKLLKAAWDERPDVGARRARPRAAGGPAPRPGPPRRARGRGRGGEGRAARRRRRPHAPTWCSSTRSPSRPARRSRAWTPGAFTAEVRGRVLDELDLEHEAQVQRRGGPRAAGAPRGGGGRAFIRRWCTDGVLVTGFAPGRPSLTPARSTGPTARRSRTQPRAVLRRRAPGDRRGAREPTGERRHRRSPTGRSQCSASARRARWSRQRLESAIAAAEALRADDAPGFAAGAVELGVLDEATALEAHRLAHELLPELFSGPALLDAPTLGGRTRERGTRPDRGAA